MKHLTLFLAAGLALCGCSTFDYEWRQAALFGSDVVSATADRRTGLLDALRTAGAPMLRLLAVLEPAR